MKSLTLICIMTLLQSACLSTTHQDTAGLVKMISLAAQEVHKTPVSGPDLVPQELTNHELAALAKALMLADWDLYTYGDAGINVLEGAFRHCLCELSKRDRGEEQLVALMIDSELRWDAAFSLTLADAIVKRGRPALHLLREHVSQYPGMKFHIELIENGARTAI